MARAIKRIVVIALLLLLAGIGYYTYAFLNFANNIQKSDSTKFGGLHPKQVSMTDVNAPPKWEGKERVNVLILGGDSRGGKNEVGRSDSIMVASIDPVTKKAHLFSILRDTYVKIPGSGNDRINAAYAIGGPNLSMKTASDLLGIPIQYYVMTDFEGFIALVDAIDGIEIDVEKDMRYKDSADNHQYDINLKKGLQHLNGEQALQYVRFRHDAMSDFSRTERQRKFLQAVAEKMQTTGSLIRLPKILNGIDPYIETNLTTTDMLKLGALAYEAKAEGMVTKQIPPAELLRERRVGGAAVLSVDRNKLHTYIKDLFEGHDPFAPAEKSSSQTHEALGKNGSDGTRSLK